jgi:hypothetical protein
MVDRMLTYAVITMMTLMCAGLAAWVLYTLWVENLKPLVSALGGAQ